MTAVEALRKARATMDCWGAQWTCFDNDCPTLEFDRHDAPEFYFDHDCSASLRLDGQSVAAVTRAGG